MSDYFECLTLLPCSENCKSCRPVDCSPSDMTWCNPDDKAECSPECSPADT